MKTKINLPSRYPILVNTSLGHNQFWSCRVDGRRYTCSYGTIGEHPTKSTTTYKNVTATLYHANQSFHSKRSEGYSQITVDEFRKLWRLAIIMGCKHKIETATFATRDAPLRTICELDPSTAYSPSIKPLILVVISKIQNPTIPISILLGNDKAWMLHACKEMPGYRLVERYKPKFGRNTGVIWPRSDLWYAWESHWEYKREAIINSSHRLHKLVDLVRQAIATMV